MTSGHQQRLFIAAAWSAWAAASLSLVSIAASQSLLGLATGLLLVSRARWQAPRFAWPLAAFVAFTFLSLAFSPDPAAGWPQIRKLYLLLALPLVFTTFRQHAKFPRRLAVAWVGVGAAAAVWGIVQFYLKWTRAAAAGQEFYSAYVADRITGFMSHWMTFSSQMMFALLLGVALLFWGGFSRRIRVVLAMGLGVIGLALILAMTRGIWIATLCGLVYLLALWRPWSVAALPVLAAVVLVAGPESVRIRATSLFQPRGEMDSNMHRIVSWRTGMAMVWAHPLLGAGPEQVKLSFDKYVPPDIPRPLPVGFYGHLHNIYLQYAAERGIPAMLSMVGVFIWALLSWLKSTRGAPAQARWILHGGVALVIGVLVTGFFEHNLGDSEILMMTFAALAATEAAASQPRPSET